MIDRTIDARLAQTLRTFPAPRPLKVMEVCGTHTVAIRRAGIQQLLPPQIRLVSGPGCPVCVTPDSFIDRAIFLARQGYLIVTFGDMLTVPGRESSLAQERTAGADIRVVYSPLEALEIARDSNRQVVFLAVGFETTAPVIALTLLQARKKKLANFFILPGNKLIPPAMTALLTERTIIDGFLLPGHVSTVLGKDGYAFLKPWAIPGVISGFTPAEIISSLLRLLELIVHGRGTVENNYRRVVRDQGNPRSRAAIAKVFTVADSDWRGLGNIPASGLELRSEFARFDIGQRVAWPKEKQRPAGHCRCGDVLRGTIDPPQCPQFGRGCKPGHPKGPCMVSSEGSCAAWYTYG